MSQYFYFIKEIDNCAVLMKGCNLQRTGGSYFIFCKLFYILLNLSLYLFVKVPCTVGSTNV